MTFKQEDDEKATFIPNAEEIATNSMYWELFVEVFDLLRSSKPAVEQQARKVVNRCRKRLGYSFELPKPHSTSTGSDLSTLLFKKTHLLLSDLDFINEINDASKIFMQLIPQNEISINVPVKGRGSRATRPSRPPQQSTVSTQQKLNQKKKPKRQKTKPKKTYAGKVAGVSKSDEVGMFFYLNYT